jgi:hypothetical protein
VYCRGGEANGAPLRRRSLKASQAAAMPCCRSCSAW